LGKMLATAAKVYERRDMELDEVEIGIITEIFEQTKKHRHF